MSLCVENFKTRKTVSFETISSIQQRFWDLSTQRIPIVLKKSFESRKVLFEVKKLSFLLHGHNSYNVWEWKTVNCKGIFVNWRSSRIFVLFCLSFFLISIIEHFYYNSFWASKGVSQSKWNRKKQSWEFWIHSKRVDRNLLAEVNRKPCVMYTPPCLRRRTLWWLIRCLVGLANARLVITTLIINRDLKKCTKVGSSWLKRLTCIIT